MVTQAELARKCSQFGTVLEVAINARRSAALVHFDCKDSAVAAADKLRGKIFQGQRLKVSLSVSLCSHLCGVLWCKWFVQRFRIERLRVQRQRSATFCTGYTKAVFGCLATDVKQDTFT